MHDTKHLITLSTLVLILLSSTHFTISTSYGEFNKAQPFSDGPTVVDSGLKVEKVIDGLDFPTGMVFVENDDILVTEKNTGKVMRILDGQVLPDPVIDLDVANKGDRGLLGIHLFKDNVEEKPLVFLAYTEDGDLYSDRDGSDSEDGIEPVGYRLYQYEFASEELINPKRLLDFTAIPVDRNPDNFGGKIKVGPDNNVYFMVGEVGGHKTQAQNIEEGPAPNGLGGIIRILQDGGTVDDSSFFGEGLPLNIYYAMGIRNSFGMDFDPLTGNLWDTENGPGIGDEINIVKPGFNSGWSLIQGFVNDDLLNNDSTPSDLVIFGSGKYDEPKFAWNIPIGLSALEFLSSNNLGDKYTNDMFVGDIYNGNLYRFTLNETRDGFVMNGTEPEDILGTMNNVVKSSTENQRLIFGQGFGSIADIQTGPDGYLYVLSFTGGLYRVLPISDLEIT